MNDLLAKFRTLPPAAQIALVAVPLLLSSCLCCTPFYAIGLAKKQPQPKQDQHAKQPSAPKKETPKGWVKFDLGKPLRSFDIYNRYTENAVDAKKCYEGRDMHLIITVSEVEPAGNGAIVFGAGSDM